MSRIKWDAPGERYYETGTKNTVLYPQNAEGKYPEGVAWNGITGITETPSGAEATDLWADDIKYGSIRSAETFGGTIEAYTFPDEFAECDGTATVAPGVTIGQQGRKAFGLCYRTTVGNDTASDEDDGYKLHLVYGATASPSEKSYSTINDSPEAITFSWEFDTTPVSVPGYKPTSTFCFNSLTTDKEKLKALEDILYGTDGADGAQGTGPRLPMPEEIIAMFKPANAA